jgi:type II secretory pathway component GspD/PulD (secretin)
MKKLKSIILLCLLVFVFSGIIYAENTVVKVFTIKNRFAEDLESSVQMILSPEGRLVTDKNTNSLIINDYPKNINAVADLLKEQDKLPQQVRIKINYVDDTDLKEAGIPVRWQYRDSLWSMGNIAGGGSGLNLNAIISARKGKRSISGEQNLLLMSGSNGTISAGRSIAYRDWFYQYSMTHGHRASGARFKDVITGFAVSPRVVGDSINVAVSPRISYMSDDGPGEIIFREAGTTVICKDGESVLIGSSSTGDENIVWNIFGGLRSEKTSGRFYIMLTAEIEK